MKSPTCLVLRCCAPDMSSQNGFVWPQAGGMAEAADWVANDECGNGLHGWLYGQGDPCVADYYHRPDAKWLAVEVEESTLRFPRCRPEFPKGQVKFPRGLVRFVGAQPEAVAFLVKHEPRACGVAYLGVTCEPPKRPPCTVCRKPHEQHGSYPTCASHPYTASFECGAVGVFSFGGFIGLPCPGTECMNGCVRGRKPDAPSRIQADTEGTGKINLNPSL